MEVACTRANYKSYMPINLLLFGEAHIKVIGIGLEAANAGLPSPLCTNPMLLLAATLDIIKSMLDSYSIVLKVKE